MASRYSETQSFRGFESEIRLLVGLAGLASIFPGTVMAHGHVIVGAGVLVGLALLAKLKFARSAVALHAAFDYELGVRDMDASIETLRNYTGCNGHVAVIGFCLGGTMSFLAGARCGIDCAAAYYGTRIQNFLDGAAKVKCPLLLHFGEIDHTTPPEIMSRIMPAVEPNPDIAVHIYPGAGHAFANPGRSDTYIHEASELAHARTFDMFRQSMPSPERFG